LADLSNLEELSLWRATRIDDAAGPVLASFKNLKTLDLAETAIADPGLASLTALTGLSKLYLSGSRVTDAGVQAFLRDRPNCKVSWK
jgi:hypothetical protein